MSRESDLGRGPVDFKFSAGWHRRALIEVKLLSSSKLFQGANAQLPQYLASEQVSYAYYLCVGFTDRDLSPERLALVRDTCASRVPSASQVNLDLARNPASTGSIRDSGSIRTGWPGPMPATLSRSSRSPHPASSGTSRQGTGRLRAVQYSDHWLPAAFRPTAAT